MLEPPVELDKANFWICHLRHHFRFCNLEYHPRPSNPANHAAINVPCKIITSSLRLPFPSQGPTPSVHLATEPPPPPRPSQSTSHSTKTHPPAHSPSESSPPLPVPPTPLPKASTHSASSSTYPAHTSDLHRRYSQVRLPVRGRMIRLAQAPALRKAWSDGRSSSRK
jgi:hypothetical protein